MRGRWRWLALSVVLLILGGGGALAFLRPDLLPESLREKLPRLGHKEEDAGLFCKEHGVPEAYCTLCHPELKDKLLLCPEHGDIPEAICTLCHPESEARYGLVMCPNGHGLPRDFCLMCGSGDAASSASSLPDDGWCATHALPEELCVLCPDNHASGVRTMAGTTCFQPLPLVRLRRPELAKEIGLELAAVSEVRHAHELIANAETAFNANMFAEVTPRVDGYLREIRSDLGDRVAAGDILAIVDSAAVSTAKSRLISSRASLELARTSYDRIHQLANRDAVPAKQEIEARTTLNQAESDALNAAQALLNLGFDPSAFDRIVKEKDTTGTLPIVTPIGGIIVARHAVRGEAVQPITNLFSVADVSRMWLWIDVYEAQMPEVAIGQRVRFRILGAEASEHEGEVTWVGAEVDPVTRTTKVRAELANPEGRLRAKQFGEARIQLGPEHRSVQVPKEAVQTYGDTQVVFLPMEPGVYRAQRIVIGDPDEQGHIEVIWGLQPSDQVVTRGAFLLKTELMRDEIGAGCCE